MSDFVATFSFNTDTLDGVDARAGGAVTHAFSDFRDRVIVEVRRLS